MKTNLDKYKTDLKNLIELGETMKQPLPKKKQQEGNKINNNKHTLTSIFINNYQKWYSEAYQVLKQLLPDRLDELQRRR